MGLSTSVYERCFVYYCGASRAFRSKAYNSKTCIIRRIRSVVEHKTCISAKATLSRIFRSHVIDVNHKNARSHKLNRHDHIVFQTIQEAMNLKTIREVMDIQGRKCALRF
jgi:hypothetical protein